MMMDDGVESTQQQQQQTCCQACHQPCIGIDPIRIRGEPYHPTCLVCEVSAFFFFQSPMRGVCQHQHWLPTRDPLCVDMSRDTPIEYPRKSTSVDKKEKRK